VTTRFVNEDRVLYRTIPEQGRELITAFEFEAWAVDAREQLNRLDEIAGAEYTDKVLWDILHYHFKREADA
jgi:hypothetical protein